MHIAAPAKTDTKLNRLLQWRAGKSPGPWQMVVFPTNRCNLKCGICWQRYAEETFGKLEHTREVSDERWLELVEEAAALNVREWSIAGGGEPFVRAALVMEMCERIRANGMNGGVYTNGTLLKREYIEHLVEIGWERLDFSIDGPTADINDAIRGAGAFERAITALRLLQEIKQAKGKQYPVVDVHCVLTRHNADKMEAMAHMVNGVGIKSLGFSMLQVESRQCEPFQITEQQLAALPAHAAKAAQLCDDLHIATNAHTLTAAIDRMQARVESEGPIKDHFVDAGCFEPFLSVAVLAEGQAGPCCAFWDEHADNIRDHSLEAIWKGSWFTTMRERLIHREFPDFCKHCPSHFVWQTEETRQALRANIAARPRPFTPALFMEGLAQIRKRGLAATVRRAYEWMSIKLLRDKTLRYLVNAAAERMARMARGVATTAVNVVSRAYKVVYATVAHGPGYGVIAARTGFINTRLFFANLFRFTPAVTCPCCGWQGNGFYSIDCGRFIVPRASCPFCRSEERHRFMNLYLRKAFDGEVSPANSVVLHFAPEWHVYNPCGGEENPRYFGADYGLKILRDPSFPCVQLDIQNLPMPDNSVDIVFCLHVLEHIPDDHRALSEIRRVLKPGGKAIIMVPFMMGQTKTVEYGGPDPAMFDHVRGYSPVDFAERLHMFSVNTLHPHDMLSEEKVREYGIPKDSQIIYECTNG